MEKMNINNLQSFDVEIPAGEEKIKGILAAVPDAFGIVIFAHGSGSSRLSPRNAFVASELQKIGLATLLIDLLSEEEELDRRNVFNISLLAERLKDATFWVKENQLTKNLPIGYFGASTGAAAALEAAADMPEAIGAVVSRGGRPDLAMEHLSGVKSPTLLIVGERDETVIGLNEAALKKLTSEKQIVIVPKATHLFEELGALEEVARLAGDWFARHLKRIERQKPSKWKNAINPKQIILFVMIFALGDLIGSRILAPDSTIKFDEPVPAPYRVIAAEDGDTIKVKIEDQTETVRLLGINAPEIEGVGAKEECYGKQASEETKRLLLDKEVYLIPDSQVPDRDKYDRLLRYVFLENGDFINAKLVKNGFAYAFKIEPSLQLLEQFNFYEREAEENKRGLWGFCGNSLLIY